MISLATTSKTRQLIHLRDLFYGLVARDIKLRYKRSVLGIAWSLLVPLAQLLIFYFVFNLVLPLNIPNYTTFLFTGILPWAWFNAALLGATGAIVENRELVRQVGFPVAILPIVTVTSHLVHFLLSLPILFILLLLDGYHLTSAILMLPFVITLQFILTLGLAYLAATFHVTFRDTHHLLGILLLLFFYLTPVFYDATAIPARFQAFYQLNPMVHILNAYRGLLLRGELPTSSTLLVLGVLSAGLLYFSYMIFMRVHYRFVEEL